MLWPMCGRFKSLENASPKDIPHLEQKLMSLPKLTSKILTQLQKNDTFCNNIITYMHCSPCGNYFTDAIGILHKKRHWLQQYILICSHTKKNLLTSITHITWLLRSGWTYKTISFYKKALLLSRHAENNTQICKNLSKCQILNLQKPHYINLH